MMDEAFVVTDFLGPFFLMDVGIGTVQYSMRCGGRTAVV